MTTALTTREETIGGLRIVREDSEKACYVKIWAGRQLHPSYFSFRSPESRERYIADRIAAWAYVQDAKAARQAARKAFDAHSVFSVGDILSASWGYDQTQVEFYEVTGLTRQTITIQEIGQRTVKSTGSMSEMVTANPRYRGGISTHRVTSESVKLNSYKFANKWSGHPMHQSSYA